MLGGEIWEDEWMMKIIEDTSNVHQLFITR